jgi:DeoR/GlpR family transcriptional regulator of sugar metabolism
MIAQERQKLILEILYQREFVEIEELSVQLKVSDMTIRRDLQKLEKAGMLTRTYGGAVNTPSRYKPLSSYNQKEILNQKEKSEIGAAAARLVQEDEIIGLGSGTTCYQVARHLNPNLECTVITNAVNIAMELANKQNIRLIMTGGILSGASYALVGPFAEEIFTQLHINKLFLGATGVSLDYGVTTQVLLEASLYKTMINVAQEVIIVADHSKFNLVTLAPIIELERVTRLITDQKTAPGYRERIALCGVEVIVAETIVQAVKDI